MKTVNLASVKFSPKWFLGAILAIALVIAAFKIATWGIDQVQKRTVGKIAPKTNTGW